jgi:threonine/homoserine/homoserine lactone efflux protein
VSVAPFWPAAPILLAFVTASLAMNVTPGLDMAFVIGETLQGGWRAGRWAALGIAGGSLCHGVLVAVGVAALLATAPRVVTVLTVIGAAYLVYVGLRMMRSAGDAPLPARAPGQQQPAPAGGDDRSRVFRRGVLGNLLNIKVVLFYLTFLPQFVQPGRAPGWQQLIFLSLLFNALGTSVLLIVAAASGRAAGLVEPRPRVATALNRAAGGILIALALGLAWSRLTHGLG